MEKIILVLLMVIPFGLFAELPIIVPELVSNQKLYNGQIEYTEHNGKVYVTAKDTSNKEELWVFDDNLNSLERLKITNPNLDGYSRIISIGLDQKFLFAARDEEGAGLWSTDGTKEGTKLIKHLEFEFFNESWLLFYSNFYRYENEVYFIAADSGDTDFELWKSDGTSEGTNLVKNLNTNGTSLILDSKVIKDKIVFRTYSYPNIENKIWVVDGKADNTLELSELRYYSHIPFIYNLHQVGERILTFLQKENNEAYLWSSDGTTEGTQFLKKAEYGAYMSGIYSFYYDELVFYVTIDDTTQEIWSSDGTLDGTRMLESLKIKAGSGVEFLYNTDVSLKKFIFSFNDNSNKRQIGISDGTPEGTLIISNDMLFPLSFYNVIYNGKVIYFSAESEDSTYTLWATDGKKNGSYQVFNSNLKTRDRSIVLHQLLPDNRLLFEFRSKSNDEVTTWVTDGTEKGTFKLTDERINRSIQLNGNVYFRSNYDKYIDVPHQSNLTRRGTQVILPSDATNTNSIMSYLTDFYSFKNHIYFFADYYGEGQQLYRIPNTISSVEESEKPELMTVYPNPAKDFIQLLLTKPMHLSIVNSAGKIVKDFGVIADGKLNVTELISGVYFVVDEQGNNIAKFVKE